MYRLWALSLLFLVSAGVFPGVVQGAELPLLSPSWHIVPDAHDLDASCPEGAPLGFGGILQFVQNVVNASVSLGVVIAILIIAFAGMLWMLTPMNPENHSQAKKILKNAALGLLIVCAAWLIVDFAMKILYSGAGGDEGRFGPWNKILIGGKACVSVTPTTPLFSGSITAIPDVDIGGATGGSAGQPGTGNCSPASIVSYGISPAISVPMSCIAMAESSCNSGAQNPTTSAHGLFQVVMGWNDTGHNLNFSVCTKAAQDAGYAVNGNLNCSTAFSGGKPKPGKEALANACKAASSNNFCNAQAAQWVYNQQGFSAWATHGKCGV